MNTVVKDFDYLIYRDSVCAPSLAQPVVMLENPSRGELLIVDLDQERPLDRFAPGTDRM
jgi:hypothetical protein